VHQELANVAKEFANYTGENLINIPHMYDLRKMRWLKKTLVMENERILSRCMQFIDLPLLHRRVWSWRKYDGRSHQHGIFNEKVEEDAAIHRDATEIGE
jgi:hypothetical protein